MNLIYTVFLTLLFAVSQNYGSKILVLWPWGPKSHSNAVNPLVEELLKRNHDVTYVALRKSTKDLPGLKTIYLPEAEKHFDYISQKMFATTTFSLQMFYDIPAVFRNITHAILNDTNFKEFLKDPGTFDVIIANAILNEGFIGITTIIGAPLVLVCPNSLIINDAWTLNIPYPASIVPSQFSGFSCKMTFLERMRNVIWTFSYQIYHYIIVRISDNVVIEYVPNAASSQDAVRNASLIILNYHFSNDCPRPSMPYAIEAGGMHCRPAGKLPEVFETFVEDSGEEGFIVFSMGSVVEAESLPETLLNACIEAFAKIKQRVIWKFEKPIKNITSNVMISKWIPQQDLMGHPKCRLAITHGGLLSLQEIVYHGVPLLGIPFGADRDGNLLKAVKSGFAETVDFTTVTSEILTEKINTMISDKSYKEKAKEISTLMKDRPFSPVETAAYWVEHVIRHKGAKHLRNIGADNLNIFQYFLLDVIAIFCIAFVIILCIVIVVIKKIIKLIRNQKKEKMKVN